MGYREDFLRQNPEKHGTKYTWYTIPLVDGELRYHEHEKRFTIMNNEGSAWIDQKDIVKMEFSGDWINIHTEFGMYSLMRKKG